MRKLLIGMVTALMSFSSFASIRCINDLHNKIVWENKTVAKKMIALSDASDKALKDGDVKLAKELDKKISALTFSALKVAEIACEK